MSRLIWILCAFACAAAQPVAAAGAPVDDVSDKVKSYQFDFEAYFGGLKVGAGQGRLSWGGRRYAMDFEARSAGMLDWVMQINQTAESSGQIDGIPIAEHHRNLNADGKKKSWIELAFSPDKVEIVDAKPHPKTEKPARPSRRS